MIRRPVVLLEYREAFDPRCRHVSSTTPLSPFCSAADKDPASSQSVPLLADHIYATCRCPWSTRSIVRNGLPDFWHSAKAALFRGGLLEVSVAFPRSWPSPFSATWLALSIVCCWPYDEGYGQSVGSVETFVQQGEGLCATISAVTTFHYSAFANYTLIYLHLLSLE